MNPSTQAVSPLRQRMIDDMRMRKLGAKCCPADYFVFHRHVYAGVFHRELG